ncbi:MAG: hypothetical protein CTY37_07125 [Methylotenera sp.]|nr:MAG: hypothetical protein CTY37_07125 [Methylotenera sp.]PPD17733.1 MAG: hypothetical protein CTY27_03245 [Methylotenera sp.]
MQCDESKLAKLSALVSARATYFELEAELEADLGLDEMTLSDVNLESFIDHEFADTHDLTQEQGQEILDYIFQLTSDE